MSGLNPTPRRLPTRSVTASALVAIIAATPFLLITAARHGSLLGPALFAGSAALLYLASTLYHAAPARRKAFFRMLDHVA